MNNRKKIVVCTTSYMPFIGGAEIAVQETSRRLSHLFDFYIITARQKRELPKREVVPEGTIIRVGFGTGFDKWLLPLTGICALLRLGFLKELPALWKRDARHSILLWGMDISQGSLCSSFIKMMFPKIPFVFTVQYGYGNARLEEGRMGAIGMAFRRILGTADAVTVISTYLHTTVCTFGYIGVAKIIPNGVDTSVFAFHSPDLSDEQKQRERNQHVIITTSRLVKKNGIDTLIRAMADARKKISAITCYIIGEGPERAALEKLVQELTLEKNVSFLGSVAYDEIPFYLRRADIFVRLSRSEGMGNSFIEAMSVGVPVIGTPVGGIPDIITDSKTGLFCRVDDPADAAEKIIMLLKDDDLTAQLRANGRHLVEEKFSWDSIAQSYGDIFEKLLNARVRALVATPLYPPDIGGPATYSKALVDDMLDEGVLIRVVRFSEVGALPKILRHAAYAWRVACTSRYVDIIYAQDPVSVGFPAVVAAMIMRKKFIMKIVGDYAWEQAVQRFDVTDLLDDFFGKSYGMPVELFRKIERFTTKMALRIVVPSHYLKTVVKRWGISEKKMSVVYNSFEIPAAITSEVETKKNYKDKKFVIISAGRLVPWKGFTTLIDAVAELGAEGAHGTDVRVSLVIIGSGPLEQQLRDHIHARGCEALVELIGNVDHAEMMKRLGAAHVFVLNTGYEGFSHAILEAMAVGTPVITTYAGGNPELITDHESGLLIEYNNKKQLVEAITSVMQMADIERKEMIRSAKEASRQFTKERMLKETAQFLISL